MGSVSDSISGADYRKNKKKITVADIISAAVFVLIAVYLLMHLRNGIGLPDESFYLTVPQRIFNGDGLVSSEWHVTQFSSFAQYPFYALFRFVTGSTDGIILFFRVLYVFFQLICSAVCMRTFGKYGVKGIVGTTCFSFFIPVTVMSVSYHTVSLWAVMIIACAFVRDKKPGNAALYGYGILISYLVLSEPFTALLWFAYTAAVIVYTVGAGRHSPRFSHCPFLFRKKTFLLLLCGILTVAAAFLLYLFQNNSLSEIIGGFRYLFTESDHDISSLRFLFSTQLIKKIIDLYGIIPFIGLVCLTVFTAALRKYRARFRPLIAAVLLLLTVFAVLNAYPAVKESSRYVLLINSFGLPVLLSGPVCMLLLEKRHRELEKFWLFSFAAGVLTDMASDITVGSAAASAGTASLVLMLLVAEESIKNFREANSVSKKVLSVFSAACMLLASISNIAFQTAFAVNDLRRPYIETYTALDNSEGKITDTITRGPLKGLYTTMTINRIYNAYLDDLDSFSADPSTPVYIYGLYGYLYLYLSEMPSGAYSAWHTAGDEERLDIYYSVHPDKVPGYIYIPYYYAFTYRTAVSGLFDSTLQDKLNEINKRFECRIEEGKAGYIVKVNNKKLTVDIK